jgi:hypothetical protein
MAERFVNSRPVSITNLTGRPDCSATDAAARQWTGTLLTCQISVTQYELGSHRARLSMTRHDRPGGDARTTRTKLRIGAPFYTRIWTQPNYRQLSRH